VIDPDQVRESADRAAEVTQRAHTAARDLLIVDEAPAAAAVALSNVAVAEQLAALRLALVDAVDRATRKATGR
jgi:hypothetical protein